MVDAGTISNFMATSLAKLAERETGTPNYPISSDDLIEQVNCPVCGSARTALISEVFLERHLRFFATAACQECLFVFRPVFPSFAWFKARWTQIASGTLEVFNQDLEAVRASRYREYLALISTFRKGGRVLEIGGGFGTGAKIFQDAGFTVEVLEPEDDRVAYISKVLRIPCHGVALEEFEARANSYDVIICAHNLEHVDKPSAQIERIRTWLRVDGLLYCEVPILWNIADFSDSLFLAHKSNFAESNFAALAQHTRFDRLETRYPKLNTPHAADLGMLMRPTHPGAQPTGWERMLGKDKERSVSDIRTAYRRHAPVKLRDEEVIRITVPRLTHFFYTIRANTGHFIDRRVESGFIEFVEDHERVDTQKTQSA